MLEYLFDPEQPWKIPYSILDESITIKDLVDSPILKSAIDPIIHLTSKRKSNSLRAIASLENETVTNKLRGAKQWHRSIHLLSKTLADLRVAPSYSSFCNYLNSILPKRKPSIAHIIARAVYCDMIASGYAMLSEAIPLLVGTRQSDFLSRTRQQLKCHNWKNQPKQAQILDMDFLFLLLVATGCRLMEPDPTIEEHGMRIFIIGNIYAFVPRGKTDSSRRVIDLFIASNGIFNEEIKDHIQRIAALYSNYNFPAKINRIKRVKTLRAALTISNFKQKFTAHHLRHQLAFNLVQRAIYEDLLRGNYHTRIATLSRILGHGSISVSEFAYIGTAVAALDIPSNFNISMSIPSAEICRKLIDYKISMIYGTPRKTFESLTKTITGKTAQELIAANYLHSARKDILLHPHKISNVNKLYVLVTAEHFETFPIEASSLVPNPLIHVVKFVPPLVLTNDYADRCAKQIALFSIVNRVPVHICLRHVSTSLVNEIQAITKSASADFYYQLDSLAT